MKKISIILFCLFLLTACGEELNRVDIDVLDYDFYLRDGELFAFVVEGGGVLKHNDLNNMDYQCGKRILVYKGECEEEYSLEELSDKAKRREVFVPAELSEGGTEGAENGKEGKFVKGTESKSEGDIKSVLAGMDLVYENDFSKVNPWTISVGQLDDDEAVEFFVGAYRPTDFYKDDPRPYFIEYKDGVFVRQWTGSYLDNLGFSEAYLDDDDFDGISDLYMNELVPSKEGVVSRWSRFNIIGFQPYRIEDR